MMCWGQEGFRPDARREHGEFKTDRHSVLQTHRGEVRRKAGDVGGEVGRVQIMQSLNRPC